MEKIKIKNLDDAEALCVVAKHKSFSLAAHEIGVPVSVVSKRVSKLEATLGTRLLNRSTRSMSLTEEGEKFFTHFQKIFGDIAEIEDNILQSGAPHGQVRVTAPISLVKAPIAKIIKKFSKKYPNIKIMMHFSDEIKSIIEEGIDIAIRITNLEDSNLITRKIGENRLKLVCTKEYLKNHTMPKSVQDLNQHNLFVIPAHRHRKFIKTGVTLSELSLNSAINTNNGQFALEMARLGLGIAVRSHWDVSSELNSGKLVELKLNDNLEKGNDVYLMIPSKRNLSKRVRLLMDTFIDELGTYLSEE